MPHGMPRTHQSASIAKRYLYVTDEVVTAIAQDIDELFWTKRLTPR